MARLFYSYSHRDEKLRDRLEEQLSLLKRRRLISGWHDRRITAGTEWRNEISAALEAADVILLLISSAFLNSDYCFDVEMGRALERHDAGTARVIPVILRPCPWKDAPFAHLQALPRDAKAITTWSNRDQAFLSVSDGIEAAVRGLAASPRAAPHLAEMVLTPYDLGPGWFQLSEREDIKARNLSGVEFGLNAGLGSAPTFHRMIGQYVQRCDSIEATEALLVKGIETDKAHGAFAPVPPAAPLGHMEMRHLNRRPWSGVLVYDTKGPYYVRVGVYGPDVTAAPNDAAGHQAVSVLERIKDRIPN